MVGSENVVVIGSCTLIKGDCMREAQDIQKETVDMIWTDPPYGHNNNDGDLAASLAKRDGREAEAIDNDSPVDMRTVVDEMLKGATRVLKKRSTICCCCGGGGGPTPTFAWLADRLDGQGLEFFHSVIWDKVMPGLGWKYRRQHEMVMVAFKKGGQLGWNDRYPAQPNIISICKPRDGWHPNEKPVDLVARFIQIHTVQGDLVWDPFMGSGTTGIACMRLGRRFLGMELDAKHFGTAVQRISEEKSQPQLIREPVNEMKQTDLI